MLFFCEITISEEKEIAEVVMNTFRVMRAIHLYSGLFLIPWMLVYAASAFVISHRDLFEKEIKRSGKLELLYEKSVNPASNFPTDPQEQVDAIMGNIGLSKPYNVLVGISTPEKIVIFRPSPGGNYRINWMPKESRYEVTRQPFALVRTVNYLHYRAGYQVKNWAFDIWAAMVDLVALSILLWIISGIYMMVTKPGKKKWSYISIVAGCIVFIVCVIAFL